MNDNRNRRGTVQNIRMQQEHIDKGKLQIQITSQVTAFPIQNAQVSISYTGVPENTLEKLQTDSSGQTEEIELAAPPIEYSLNPESDQQPYSEYTLNVEAEGFEPVSISGAEILADVTAIQNISMRPQVTQEEPGEVFVIPAHTLYGEYPAKIAEDEIKPVTESGEIVLSRVVIPEFVVVHDGSPRDSTARNYYVRYRDYIKNVASSEIYAKTDDTVDLKTILEDQIKKIDVKLQRIKEAYMNGIDTMEEYKENKQAVQEEKQHLEKQLSEIKEEKSNSKDDDEDMLLRVKNVYDILSSDSVDATTKNDVLRSVVEQIIYEKDKDLLKVYYYYMP